MLFDGFVQLFLLSLQLPLKLDRLLADKLLLLDRPSDFFIELLLQLLLQLLLLSLHNGA